MLKEHQFESVIPLVSETLRTAAAESPQRLSDVARELVRWRGFFQNTLQAKGAEPYFRTLFDLLEELAGPESPETIAAAENLGGLLGSIDRLDEAIPLRERALAYLSTRFPSDDPRVTTVRDGLSVLYRRAGRTDKLEQLFAGTTVCEHLQVADRYVRGQGAQVISAGRPWSANCRLWIYFDALLDCESLISGLGLASCIEVHDHRGTHDGSERGIVCTVHNDGLMGPHPQDAPTSLRTIRFVKT